MVERGRKDTKGYNLFHIRIRSAVCVLTWRFHSQTHHSSFAEYVRGSILPISRPQKNNAHILSDFQTDIMISSSLFLVSALLLWAFNISQDPLHPIDTMGFSDGQSIRPSPFMVNFEPRMANVEELVISTLS